MELKPHPRRKNLRMPNFDYGEPGFFFVTICTANKNNLFGSVLNGEMVLNSYGVIAGELWLEIPDHFPSVELDEFIIMPNHIHGILSLSAKLNLPELPNKLPEEKSPTLGIIVGSYKSAVSKRINLRRNTPGDSIWHRSYYDHILRTNEEAELTFKYMEFNPDRFE